MYIRHTSLQVFSLNPSPESMLWTTRTAYTLTCRILNLMTESDEDTQIRILRKGMMRQGDPQFPPGMVEKTVEEHFRVGITPQLGDGYDLTNVHQALIEIGSEAQQVRINEDATWWAICGEEGYIATPQERFVGVILDVFPDRIHPLTKWMGFTRSNDGSLIVALDLVGNVERTLPLLDRAHDFHLSASLSLDAGLQAPAAAALFSAAEQATMSLISIVGYADNRQHTERVKWLRDAAKAHEVPAEFARAFKRLDKLRNPARYEAVPLGTSVEELLGLAATTRQLIEFAKSRRTDLEDDM